MGGVECPLAVAAGTGRRPLPGIRVLTVYTAESGTEIRLS
jgi:hypothetical protein